jgi:predicted dehydrogenase
MMTRIGLIGCGNISDVYLTNAKLFRDVHFSAVSSRNMQSAKIKGAQYGIPVLSVEGLLASKDIDIVLNLTIPSAHCRVTLAAIEAGKHVYTEKPLASSMAEGKSMLTAARAKGLRIGCAPDTVLGSGIQTARAAIEQGVIGRPLIGVASVLSHGMESWHPNPAFFFQAGGGPVFDLGPYYISALVTMLGPVKKVMAVGQQGFTERTAAAADSQDCGKTIRVEVLTSVQALLDFESGAQITFQASWDVWRHSLPPIELHGTRGSIQIPDPDWFGGPISIARGPSDWEQIDTASKIFGRVNWPVQSPSVANYRGLGLADMVRAISEGHPHRASVELGLHTLAVMSAIIESADQGTSVAITEHCQRPEPITEDEAKDLLADAATHVK